MRPLKGTRVEVYQEHKDPGGDVQDHRSNWRWRYVANGRILADSGEGYRQRAKCIRMVWKLFGSLDHESKKLRVYILGIGADPRLVEYDEVE